MIEVEVVYTQNQQDQKCVTIFLADGLSIRQAIEQSGIRHFFPEIDLSKQKVGIFSKIKSLNDIVQAGDRIEIYRPLVIDPKENRRVKAKEKETKKADPHQAKVDSASNP